MVSKYDAASKIARHGKPPSRKVYDLLLAADEEGDARATYALATWYLFGNRFCKKNFKQAVELLKRAAKANIADAVYDLGVSYERGNGTKKSLRKAFRCYVKAAMLGDAQAHHEIGRMYFHGIGTPKDLALADIWLDKAESLGITE